MCKNVRSHVHVFCRLSHLCIDLTNSCVATLNMLYFTCGGIVGNTLVGYAFEYGGSTLVYFAGAACMGGALILFNSERASFDQDLAVKGRID